MAEQNKPDGALSITKYDTPGGEVTISSDTVRKYLVRGGGNVSDQEVLMFLSLCKYQKINPFINEAYLIKYGTSDPAAMVVGKDCFLKRAVRNSRYKGHEVEISEDGQKARASVYVEGYKVAIVVEVDFSEYVGKKKDGSITKMWRTKGRTMLKKVALVQALREAFPEDLSQMYLRDEFEQDLHPGPVTGKPEVTPTTRKAAGKKAEPKADKGKGEKPKPEGPMPEAEYKKAVAETTLKLSEQGMTADEIAGILVKAGYLADTAAAESTERHGIVATLRGWIETPQEETRNA